MNQKKIIEILEKYKIIIPGSTNRVSYKDIASEVCQGIDNIIQLLKIAKCPDCDGSGVCIVYKPKTNESESQQCAWCANRDIIIQEHKNKQP